MEQAVRADWVAAFLRSQGEEGEDMNNTGCVLMEPVGQRRTTHLSRALTLLASELGRKDFLGSRMGLTEPPDGTALEGEAPVLACGLHQLGLGAPPLRILRCLELGSPAPYLIRQGLGVQD